MRFKISLNKFLRAKGRIPKKRVLRKSICLKNFCVKHYQSWPSQTQVGTKRGRRKLKLERKNAN
ncbi:MAG: hypothetical protein DRR16_13705 [Candidatus Parabeggiatoa sp. nov. 3]|nr:MAG: hypothetical protein DRR00_00035 [Gammaproteobacteria bacterium]RKZ65266.1 MAG: hypothetical protein DRQ99_13170 [Gammaproteobacteria bacterium]RKZ84793.1 MAG: hypothetical protein DRR16_13705 [Gammaproteobacteria bacterium]